MVLLDFGMRCYIQSIRVLADKSHYGKVHSAIKGSMTEDVDFNIYVVLEGHEKNLYR